MVLLPGSVLFPDSTENITANQLRSGGRGGEKKPDACVMDGAPRRMRAVDLIEFATAALYTSEGQPMRAHTLHRLLLLLLHPATTTATLVCPQQGSRIDVSASQKNQMNWHLNQKFSQTKSSWLLIDPFSLHLRIMSSHFNPVIMFYWIILAFDVIRFFFIVGLILFII